MRSQALKITGLAIIATGVIGFSLYSRPTVTNTQIRGGSNVSSVPSFVTTAAQSQAAHMGDPSPTSVECVLTTRQAAVQSTMAARVDSNPSVYLVVMHGHFIDRYARIPPGQPFPEGTTILFTIDTKTHSILDFGRTKYGKSLASCV